MGQLISFIKLWIDLLEIKNANTTIWDITLSDPWFEFVKSGEKKFEGRRYFSKYKMVQKGDYFRISHHSNKSEKQFFKKIVDINRFATFRDALKFHEKKIQQLLPTIETVQEGVLVYYKYVSEETQIKDGVVLFELENI